MPRIFTQVSVAEILRRADPDSRETDAQQTWQPAQAFRGGTQEMAFSQNKV